jgi:ribosome-associated protein
MTSITVKPTSTADKKDVQKLQRAIIDGLEDVKAQDIQVFDTEHITSLFERVIIASGTSNRQTKALAASVRDAVRDAGFAKPRIEGEANGEWIIVDCGSAVAHIMQPTIRQYYHLEELWGDKPVKLKLGAPAPLVKASKPEVKVVAAPVTKRKPAAKTGARKPAKAPAKDPAKVLAHVTDSSYVGRVGKTNDWTAKRNAAVPAAEPIEKPRRASAKGTTNAVAAKSAARPAARTAAKPSSKPPIVKVPVTKKLAAKKAAVKTAAKTTSKPAIKKPAVKRATPRSA